MFLINAVKTVRFPLSDEAAVIFTMRDPTQEEYQKYLSEAFPMIQGKAKYNQVAASVTVFDAMCLDVSGVEYIPEGGKKPEPLTNKAKLWKQAIPAHIKRAVVAQLLEGSKPETIEAKKV